MVKKEMCQTELIGVNFKPLIELSDLELLDLYKIVLFYENYDPHGNYEEYENFYGFCSNQIEEILASRLKELEILKLNR